MEATSAQALRRLRSAEARDGAMSLVMRRDALRALRAMVRIEAERIAAAIDQDFGGRSRHETLISEVAMVLGAIDHALPRLKRWSRPERVGVGWRFWPARGEIVKQPLGIVGIIAPWNYPLQLSLLPLVGALAAGCRAVVKVSEHTPACSALVCRGLAKYVDSQCVIGIEGGPEEAAAMTSLAFDKLFFTGATGTGRRVLRAAAENLVPTVLELGGKSPAIIDASADLSRAAADIIAGKLLNAGQTCVAPDHVFVPREKRDAFVIAAKSAARALYPDPQSSDYTAICRPADLSRLASLCEGFDVVPLFDVALPPPKMMPVLVLDPPMDGRLMGEEIFGPILPVIAYDDVREVYRCLAAKPAPLALYWFGHDKRRREEALAATRSGGVAFNDTIMQVAVEALPFGGLGASGMGAYHGRCGFETFTHRRAVFTQHPLSATRWLRPPYGPFAERIFRQMTR